MYLPTIEHVPTVLAIISNPTEAIFQKQLDVALDVLYNFTIQVNLLSVIVSKILPKNPQVFNHFQPHTLN